MIETNLSGAVILSGLVIGFLVVMLLIWLVGKAGKIANQSSLEQDKPVRADTKMRPNAPVVQQGIEEEIVAAIMAAVYSCMDAAAPGVPFAVKSISRAPSGRPVWGFAGVQQNTHPF